ncbi:phage terminase-like protein large subunit [Escherichia coli 2534-86]|nr:phage terminase-like protein large subunit [Escherichia coli 2534-86]
MSKHANVEIGLALRSDRWAGADFWEQQGRRVSLDDILQRADVVTVGIDGGGLDDLLGMYVTGRDRETREWLGWGHAWVHETAVVRRKSEASRFQDFVACGDMTIVRRVGDDTAEVADGMCIVFMRLSYWIISVLTRQVWGRFWIHWRKPGSPMRVWWG